MNLLVAGENADHGSYGSASQPAGQRALAAAGDRADDRARTGGARYRADYYKVLGTDGFGRSDFRSKLREHFEINRHYIVIAALKSLADEGLVPMAKVAEAISKYGIDTDKINPLYA